MDGDWGASRLLTYIKQVHCEDPESIKLGLFEKSEFFVDPTSRN
jgi:hypothetical protein